MADLFSIDNIFTLFMLILLQAVLGFDNLLYLSLESKKAAPETGSFVRKTGIGLTIFLSIGLFLLLIVGVMLLSEGGHLAHIEFFGNPIEPMRKTTVYFVIIVLAIVDIIHRKYQKKIIKLEQSEETVTTTNEHE